MASDVGMLHGGPCDARKLEPQEESRSWECLIRGMWRGVWRCVAVAANAVCLFFSAQGIPRFTWSASSRIFTVGAVTDKFTASLAADRLLTDGHVCGSESESCFFCINTKRQPDAGRGTASIAPRPPYQDDLIEIQD